MADLTQGRWQRIETILHAALEQPAAARAALLAQACAGDAALLEEVSSLLAAHAVTGELALDQRAHVFGAAHGGPAAELTPGMRVGPYRIETLLGRGGMGEVYRAARADGVFEQQVAIKLIRPEAVTHLERFHAERQILASLEHPGIARLLDGGTLGDGRPYMAMEYVDGATLMAHCQARKPDLTARLDLFRQICEAVAYAHAHLVVHRDLKSVNVMVTAAGQIKLLDFGIAKLIDAQTGDATLTQLAPLTPESAAPEQLTGAPITTATDVYALGVILHGLLSGAPLWDFSHMPLSKALHQALHQTPPAPSELAARNAQAPVAARLLRGDLDAIVAHCLRKEPRERYPTVVGLATDLARYQRGEPVSAGPDSLAYRSRKFIRRHRLPVAAAAALVVLLAGFTWRLSQAEQRAQQEAAAARQVSDYMVALFGNASPDRTGGQAIEPRRLVDSGREQLRQQLRDQPLLRARMLGSLARAYQSLGLTGEALATTAEAQQLLAALPQSEPLLNADLHEVNANAQLQAQNAKAAQREFEQALALYREHAPGEQRRIAELMAGLGATLQFAGDYQPAAAQLNQALALLRQSGAEDSSAGALAYSKLGELEAAKGLDAARPLMLKAIEINQRLFGKEHPDYLRALSNYASSVTAINPAEGLPLLREALGLSEKLYGADSIVTIKAVSVLGLAVQQTGHPREAVAMAQRVVATQRRSLDADSLTLCESLNNLGQSLEDLGDYEQAVAAMRESYEIAQRNAETPAWVLHLLRYNLGGVMTTAGHYNEALALQLPEIPPAALEAWSMGSGIRHGQIGTLYREMGRYADAEREYALGEAAYRSSGQPPDSPRFAAVARNRAKLALKQGHAAEAVHGLRAALSQLEPAFGSGSPLILEIKLELAEALLGSGARAEAETLMSAAAPAIRAELAPSHHAQRRLARLQQLLSPQT